MTELLLFLLIILLKVLVSLAVLQGLNEVSEVPRMILLHIVDQVLSQLFLIELPNLLLILPHESRSVLVDYTLKMHLMLSKDLLFLSFSFFLLVLLPFFLSKLFLVHSVIIVLLLIVDYPTDSKVSMQEIEVLGR